MGCILNNGGLGAGVVDLFSTRGIHAAFTIVGEGLDGWGLRAKEIGRPRSFRG